VCTGKFTKRIEEIQACNKEYVATFMLGATTPSFDRETEIDRTFSTDGITRERVEQVLLTFVGEQDQVPPLFSAKQIGGQRAYVAARKGREVELKPSRINIEQIELMDCSLPQVTVNIKCSKGTYIRALARDFGERLGSGAYLHDLRRTVSGDFSVNNAIEITEFEKIIRNLQPIKKIDVNDSL
jgi:tRNA pseudouridine55 synthase